MPEAGPYREHRIHHDHRKPETVLKKETQHTRNPDPEVRKCDLTLKRISFGPPDLFGNLVRPEEMAGEGDYARDSTPITRSQKRKVYAMLWTVIVPVTSRLIIAANTLRTFPVHRDRTEQNDEPGASVMKYCSD